MTKYDALLQVVNECDYRVVDRLSTGCGCAETRCLLGRGTWNRQDRHLVNPQTCLECTKKEDENERIVAEDSEDPAGVGGDTDPGGGPPGPHLGDGAAGRRAILPVVQESGLEREVLRIERELMQLWADVNALSAARFPASEQQLAGLWYSSGCTTPTSALTASVASPQASGTSITFTETLTGLSTPTGTVQFKENSTNIGTLQTLSGGVASVTTSSLPVGSLTISAIYSGDSVFCPLTATIPYTITSAGVTWGGCTNVPTTLYAHDSRYGVATMTYNSGSGGYFEGCIGGINHLGGSCPAVNPIAIKYHFATRVSVTISWVSTAGGRGQCPISSTCGSTFNSTSAFIWNGGSGGVSCGPTYSTSSINSTDIFADYSHLGYTGTETLVLKTTP